MDTKLTLKLDKEVIEKAKKYASSQNRSLSGLIESFLKSLVNPDQPKKGDEIEISSFVKSLKTGVQIPTDLDEKKVYRDHLANKHA